MCSEFWEARGQWYPTWKNGTTDDNALQVDYIRLYAATVKNERNETYNVGGSRGQYLWQENCTFDAGRIVNSREGAETCGDNCWNNKECSTFSIENGKCFLRKLSWLPDIEFKNGAICGYIPSRLILDPINQSSHWFFVAIPCIFIFLIIVAVLIYRYKVLYFLSSY